MNDKRITARWRGAAASVLTVLAMMMGLGLFLAASSPYPPKLLLLAAVAMRLEQGR